MNKNFKSSDFFTNSDEQALYSDSSSDNETTIQKPSKHKSKHNTKDSEINVIEYDTESLSTVTKSMKPCNISFIKGDKGECGERGPKGDRGHTGADGPRGDRGKDGKTGPRGVRGRKGDMGISFKWKGNWCENETYCQYDVVYYNGSSYISLTDNTSKPDCNVIDWNIMAMGGCCGEKGEKGECGEKGEKGDCGEKGEKGDCGEKGGKGEKGDCGEKGDKGMKGDKGDSMTSQVKVTPVVKPPVIAQPIVQADISQQSNELTV